MFRILAVALALGVSMPAFAVDESAVGIKVRKQSGINFVTGGIGDEAEAFAEISSRYPIRLRFTADGQNIEVRGVRVKVLDAKGDSVIEATAEGPLFYVSPPSGRWTFEVEWQGQTQSQTKDLTGRRYLDMAFDFKSAP